MRLIFNGIWTCEFHGMLWDFSCKTIGPNSFIIHLSHSAFPCSVFETETTSYFSTILFFLKFRFVFFELLCGHLTANFLPLLRISLTYLMFITAFYEIRCEVRREPRCEVWSLSPAERLEGFKPRTFKFWL